jgi:two-component system cell cycle sensor histidine kinase/response regulator CckA
MAFRRRADRVTITSTLAAGTPTKRRRSRSEPKAVAARPPGVELWERGTGPEMEAVRAAMDALPIGVVFAEFVPGLGPSVLRHNAAYGRIVGAKLHPATPFDEVPFSLYLPDRMTRVPPDEWPAPTAARTGSPVPERELHLRRSNGEWRVLMVSAAPLAKVPGELAGRAAGVLLDVTERRRAEEDLSRRGQLLRLVIETSSDPVFVKNRKSQILFANPATMRAIGKPADQVVGHRDREFYDDPSAGHAIEENDRRIMERGVEEVVEETVPGLDGTRVFLSTKTPWRDSTGAVIGLIGIARDITARKAAEEALRSSERRFRALIEHSIDMLLLVDGGGVLRFWSPAASEVLGWSEAEVLGTRALALTHPEDIDGVARAFREASRAGGGSVRHRARMRHRDGGYRLVDGVARDLRDDPAIGAVVLNVRDVTEQVRTEELLLQSQKLDSIGRLAGGIAHDFNNLLTVILCSAESEAEAIDAGKAVDREDVEQIREAGERARDLTRRLLSFARRQVIAPATVDLNATLAGSEGLLQRLLGETIRLETSPGADLWPVHCDPAQIEQVLFNLVVNARDAMPSGGTLAIGTANVQVGPGQSVTPAGDWVRLRVRDSGGGMSREVKDHLFEPFFTTKPSGHGTGLGLATVYGAVRQAGGHVRVESEPGKGTTFDVLLPRAAPVAAEAGPPVPATVPGGTETLILVEDDSGVREAAARALRSGGYRVVAAAGAAEAVEAVRAEAQPPAMLVTDVVMPDTTGRELADRLRLVQPGLRVLFLSGYAQEVIGPHGVLDPSESFLAKPFTATSLLSKVRSVLDAG